MNETSGYRLKKLLKERNIKQKSFAYLCDYMTPENLNLIIRNENPFTEKHALIFADHLGCNPDYLTLKSNTPYGVQLDNIQNDIANLVTHSLLNKGYIIENLNDIIDINTPIYDKTINIKGIDNNKVLTLDCSDVLHVICDIQRFANAWLDNMLIENATEIN